MADATGVCYTQSGNVKRYEPEKLSYWCVCKVGNDAEPNTYIYRNYDAYEDHKIYNESDNYYTYQSLFNGHPVYFYNPTSDNIDSTEYPINCQYNISPDNSDYEGIDQEGDEVLSIYDYMSDLGVNTDFIYFVGSDNRGPSDIFNTYYSKYNQFSYSASYKSYHPIVVIGTNYAGEYKSFYFAQIKPEYYEVTINLILTNCTAINIDEEEGIKCNLEYYDYTNDGIKTSSIIMGIPSHIDGDNFDYLVTKTIKIYPNTKVTLKYESAKIVIYDNIGITGKLIYPDDLHITKSSDDSIYGNMKGIDPYQSVYPTNNSTVNFNCYLYNNSLSFDVEEFIQYTTDPIAFTCDNYKNVINKTNINFIDSDTSVFRSLIISSKDKSKSSYGVSLQGNKYPVYGLFILIKNALINLSNYDIPDPLDLGFGVYNYDMYKNNFLFITNDTSHSMNEYSYEDICEKYNRYLEGNYEVSGDIKGVHANNATDIDFYISNLTKIFLLSSDNERTQVNWVNCNVYFTLYDKKMNATKYYKYGFNFDGNTLTKLPTTSTNI